MSFSFNYYKPQWNVYESTQVMARATRSVSHANLPPKLYLFKCVEIGGEDLPIDRTRDYLVTADSKEQALLKIITLDGNNTDVDDINYRFISTILCALRNSDFFEHLEMDIIDNDVNDNNYREMCDIIIEQFDHTAYKKVLNHYSHRLAEFLLDIMENQFSDGPGLFDIVEIKLH